MVIGVPLAKPLIDYGQLVGLAVMDTERHPLLPDVPSIVEAGISEPRASGWAGFNVPAGTPQPIIDKINAAVAEVVGPGGGGDDRKDRLVCRTAAVAGEFGDFLKSEMGRWAQAW